MKAPSSPKSSRRRAPRLRSYIVPVVHVLEFGVEVRVQAPNAKAAKRLAEADNGSLENVAGGYDWNRQTFVKAKLGTWAKVVRDE